MDEDIPDKISTVKTEKEADFEILHNPARVVKAQVCLNILSY
jgi:hypothetical protein